MAAPRSTWAGSIRLAGFPVNVRFYERVKTRHSQSFKMLDPVHKQPVQSVLLDQAGNRVERAETVRGVEVGKQVYELPPEALQLIERFEKSESLDIDRFSSRESIPFELAINSFDITPDEKVPGSSDSTQTFWNGLNATGRAAVISGWCPRMGSKPSTVVVVATDTGLVGYLMPFSVEVNQNPAFEPQVNEQAAKIMGQFIESGYSTEDFDLDAYRDEQAERRQAAIDIALSGESSSPALPAPVKAPTVPNLMEALEAAINEQAKKKPARKRTTKPTSKAAA